MAHALAHGRRALGRVWPNPAVGCVLVKEGRVIGRGVTQSCGRPHGETMALAMARDETQGATAYVTLEPCAHAGKTPPCARAMIDAGVARVVTALTDPDPRVAGKGHEMLKDAGILVTKDVLAAEARQDHAGFLKRVTQGLPFVTLKMAQSLDGRAAMASGESRWITGPLARQNVQAMRLSHDAVLVGAGTARDDDPDLQVRNMGAVPQPLRIVIDPRLSLPINSRLGQSLSQEAPLWLVHSNFAPQSMQSAWAERGAILVPCQGKGSNIDLQKAFSKLAELGLTRILCEGGPTLAAGLISAKLVDQIVTFNAGLTLGNESQAVLGQLHLTALSQATGWQQLATQTIGNDVMTTWGSPQP